MEDWYADEVAKARAELDEARGQLASLERTLRSMGHEVEVLRAEAVCGKLALDAAEQLYGVMANVDGGNWSRQTGDWLLAATRAREAYHQALNARYPPVGGPSTADVVLPLDRRVLEVLRNDYKMLIHVAKDRLASLNEAFPTPPAPPEGLTPDGDVAPRPGWEVIPDPGDVGHPI
jgi:hypothetical protein